jgi:hypothetical protein
MMMMVAAGASYESYPISVTQSISLYQRLGGKPTNQAVVDDFVWWVKAAELLSVLSPMRQDLVERR